MDSGSTGGCMPNVFISYRRKDSGEVVGRMYDFLSARLPSGKVFRDLDTIPFGSSFPDVINEAIARADIVLVVMGPDWMSPRDANGTRRIEQGSDPVRLEVETALAHGKPILPVLVRGASFPNAAELPDTIRSLSKFNALPIRPDPEFHGDMKKLLAVLTDATSEFLKQNQAKLSIESGYLRGQASLENHGGGFQALQIMQKTEHARDEKESAWHSKLFKALNSTFDYDQIEQKGRDLIFPGGKITARVEGKLSGEEVRDVLQVSGDFTAASIWNTLLILPKLGLPAYNGSVSECGLVLAEGSLALKEMYRLIRADDRFELLEADGMQIKATIVADTIKCGFRYARKSTSATPSKMELSVAISDAAHLQSLFLLISATVQAASLH